VSHPQRQRTPATLASWLQRVMARATRHLPALSSLGAQLHQHAAWHAGGMQASLHALHESITAVEWIPVSSPADAQAARAKLATDASIVKDCATRALEDGETFLQRSSVGATRLAPVLADFLVEFRSLEKVVDRCGDWLQQLDEGIARQRKDAIHESVLEALDALAERATDLRSRLALLQAVDRSARNVHALADNLATTRPKLADAVEGKIKPSCVLLGARADHILQAGTPSARAAATLASARTDAQIWVTQAMSLALRVHTAQERLVREAAALRHRCGLMPGGGQDLDRLDGARLKLRRGAELVPPTGIEPVSSA
jgi:hypothetical protein